jgi:hypothetical protein
MMNKSENNKNTGIRKECEVFRNKNKKSTRKELKICKIRGFHSGD